MTLAKIAGWILLGAFAGMLIESYADIAPVWRMSNYQRGLQEGLRQGAESAETTIVQNGGNSQNSAAVAGSVTQINCDGDSHSYGYGTEPKETHAHTR